MNSHVVLIIDKSGSMAHLTDDTIGGFNAYLDNLEDGQKVSAMLFDTQFKVLFKDKSPKKAKRLSTSNYIASGGTALLDAVGKTLEELSFPKGDKVLCVIQTDGQENSSREFTHDRVKSLVNDKKGEGWDFMYIGADASAWSCSRSIGISTQNTYVTDIVNGQNLRMSYNGLTSASNMYFNAVILGKSDPGLAASATYASVTAPITTAWSNANV